MKKPLFVLLAAAAMTLIVAPVAWLTLLMIRGEAPNLIVVGALSLVGALVGVMTGSRFWDDRETARQRIAQDEKGVREDSVD